MMQVVAVFVDCFPFIRGSHFVDPVWVVVQLVFGSFARVRIFFFAFYIFRITGGRYWRRILIFIIFFPTVIQCPFLINLIQVIGNHRYPDNAGFINGWIIPTPTSLPLNSNLILCRYPAKIFKSLTKKLRNGIMKIQKAIPCRRFAKVSFKK